MYYLWGSPFAAILSCLYANKYNFYVLRVSSHIWSGQSYCSDHFPCMDLSVLCNLQTKYSVLTVAYCGSLRNTRRTIQNNMQWSLSATIDMQTHSYYKPVMDILGNCWKECSKRMTSNFIMKLIFNLWYCDGKRIFPLLLQYIHDRLGGTGT